jgi:hypothetical protein
LDRSPDVTHEVKPVKTGHRLVLSYRLKDNTLHSVEIIPKPTNDEAELQRLLLTWKENLKRSKLPFVMGYLLQNQYKDVDLSYNELKGRDKEVVSYLREAYGVAGFYLSAYV